MVHYTREQWGARPRRSNPGTLSPARVDGIALHWPATPTRLSTVPGVMAALRGWQNDHMDTQGWSDIGYQEAIDQMGNSYDLRGLTAQSAANGGTAVNQQYGALLLIVAQGEAPTTAMIETTQRRVAAHRQAFPRSVIITGHGAIRPGGSECPGPAIRHLISVNAFQPQQEDEMNPAQEARLFARLDGLPRSMWGYTNPDVPDGGERQVYGHLLGLTRSMRLQSAQIAALSKGAEITAADVAAELAPMLLDDLTEALAGAGAPSPDEIATTVLDKLASRLKED